MLKDLTTPLRGRAGFGLSKTWASLRAYPVLARWLAATWFLFALLVLFKIHGSSIDSSVTALNLDVPGGVNYVLNPLSKLGQDLFGIDPTFSGELLGQVGRDIRADEWVKATPAAMAQAAHDPPFPVINTNIGFGQNMLVTSFQTQPVWHITELARAATWGYILLGVERGLAWQWWFPVAGCFTVLLLLFRIILKGRTNLAAFGALWFCGSAYVVAWSFWPAQTVMWAGLVGLNAYWLAAARNWRWQLLNGVLMGVGVIGFAMMLYPPWQIPLVYLFAFIFIGLVLRDKLYLGWRQGWLVRLACLGVAGLIAAGLGLAWLAAAWDALQAVSNTVYPGKRVSQGGDYFFAILFKGNFNLLTLYQEPYNPINQSESAGFYMLYPAVFGALILSARLRRVWGWLGWLLVVYIVGMLEFMFLGIPAFVAKITLMSYVTSGRVDIGVGLASIIASLYLFVQVQEHGLASTPRRHTLVVGLVTLGVMALFFWNALSMRVYYTDWPFFQLIVLVPIIAGAMVYWLLQGRSRAFCAALGIIAALTGLFFNPLESGLGFIYNSDLAQQIQEIDATDPASETGQKPMWLEYGSNFPIIPALGGRSLTVTMWYPQYDLWQKLDPGLTHQDTYNRHLYVNLNFTADPSTVGFANPTQSVLGLTISPLNPILQSVGAKYVLGVGDSQAGLDQTTLVPLYRAPNHGYTIYRISTAPSNQPDAPPDASLAGGLDVYSCSNIAGWVWNAKQPDQPVKIGLYDGDKLVLSWMAAVYRSDLETAGVGNGRHGFAMAVPKSLQDGQPHLLSVRVTGSGYTIPLPGGSAPPTPLTCTGG